MKAKNSLGRTIIVADDIDRRVLSALRYAKTISRDIVVFGVAKSPEEERSLRQQWARLDTGITLVLRICPDGGTADLLLDYVGPDEQVAVILVRLVGTNWVNRMLYNHSSRYLEKRLGRYGNITVIPLPYELNNGIECAEQIY